MGHITIATFPFTEEPWYGIPVDDMLKFKTPCPRYLNAFQEGRFANVK